MQPRERYLIVDGHSVIFAWPELRKLHARRSSLAREALIKQLRNYQDWTGARVVVVFDGKGKKVEATSDPADVQIFYSRSGQSADAIIELLLLARAAGQPLTALGRGWPHFAVAGTLMNGVYLATAYVALQYLHAGTMGLLAALNPMLVALLGSILLGERMRAAQWLGLGLGVAGVALVVGFAPVPGQSVPAAVLAVGGIVALAVGTIYFRRHCGPGALLAGNAVQMGAAAVFCALLGAAVEPLRLVWTWRLVACTLYLALAVSVGAMGLFAYMLRSRTAGVVSSNFYVIPGLTAVLAWLVLGETLSVTAAAGFVLSSVGVWLAQRETPAS